MERDRTFISRRLGLRATVGELLLTAVVLGLGVNLIATWISDHVGDVALGITGVLLAGSAGGFILYTYFRAQTISQQVHAVAFRDHDTGDVLEVSRYWFGHDSHMLLRAAFRENPALERQWRPAASDGAIGTNPDELEADYLCGHSTDMLIELTEYIVLEKISTFLTDYFNQLPSKEKQEQLQTYLRNDVPNILLSNRFLELFSRDMRDRVGFDDHEEDEDDSSKTVVAVFGDHYFSRFDLTLPRKSQVTRDESWITISAPRTTIRFRVTYGYSAYIPWDFEKYWMRRSMTNTDAYNFDIELEVKVRPPLSLKRNPIADGVWAQELVNSLHESLDFAHFLDEMHWPTASAVLSRLDPNDNKQNESEVAHAAKDEPDSERANRAQADPG